MNGTINIRHAEENRAEVWKFTLFYQEVVLILREYHVEERASKRHKWKIRGWYDYTNLRDCSIKEPPLPDFVKRAAFSELMNKVQVLRFEEFKKIYG